MFLRIMNLEERIVLNAVGLGDAGEDDAPEPEAIMHDPVPAGRPEAVGGDDSESAAGTESSSGSREILVVDSSVRDAREIVEAGREGVEVIVMGQSQNGVKEVAQVLRGRENVSAIHVVSHGAPGQLGLGISVLDLTTLDSHADDLEAWGNALTADGDILLYGCATGQGVSGIALVQRIADLTDADVAASTNDTASAAAEGDWALEYATGPIEAYLPFDVHGVDTALDTVTVTTLVDENDGGAAGTGWALRDAILYANSHAGDDTVSLPAGTYTLSITGRSEDNGLTGDLDITQDLTIQGAGADTTIINAGSIDRVLDVFPGATLTLRDVTITGGTTQGAEDGGGIQNDGGTLVIVDSRVVDNTASGGALDGGNGGGIYSANSGNVTLEGTVVSDNTAQGNRADGGGIYIVGGTLTVGNSTVTRNASDSEHSKGGGGVYIGAGTTASISHTTISDNQSDGRGGGICNAGTTEVDSSNVIGNDARADGGGIYVEAGSTMKLTRTVIMGNRRNGEAGVSGSDVSGDFDPDSSQNMIGVLSGSTGLEDAGQPAPPQPAVPGGRRRTPATEEVLRVIPIPDTDELPRQGRHGRNPLRGAMEAVPPLSRGLDGSSAGRQITLDMSMPNGLDRVAYGSTQSLVSRAAGAFHEASLDARSNMGSAVAGDVEGGTLFDTWISGSSVFEKWLRIGMSRFSRLRVPLTR